MTDLLSFNDPEKSDISIQFTTGNVIHMSSETLVKTFEYFEATSSMKHFDKIYAPKLFHDENVLAEALIRAQFGDRFQLAITHENWVAHLHLCDMLSATETHWNYILSWLPKLNIVELDKTIFDYMSKHAISRHAVTKTLSGVHVKRHCYYCSGYQSFNGNKCTRCGRDRDTPAPSNQPYIFVPILNWVATQHNHAPMDIIETRNLIRTHQPNGCNCSLPPNAEKCSFML